MTASDLKVGGLLLAAGGSTRLGSPKQLVNYSGEALVRHAARALVEAGCQPVVVVIGSDAESIRAQLRELDLTIVENLEWQAGMSSSIRTGLNSLLTIEPNLNAVLISLTDQPLITQDHLRKFVESFSAGSPPIITAEYDGVHGVPALFDRSYFHALTNIRGDKGARNLIRNEAARMAISLPEAAVDIDTAADLRIIRKSSGDDD